MSLIVLRDSMIAFILCAGMSCGGVARAQDSAKAAQDTNPAVTFDLPVQSLADSLNAVAVQGNVQIFFEQDTTEGLVAPPVSGNMPVRAALVRLLMNTNLELVQDSGGAFVVRRKAVIHVRRKVPVSKPAAPALTVATAPVPGPVVRQELEHPWELRMRAQYEIPLNGEGALVFPAIGSNTMSDTAYTGNGWAPEIGLEYFVNGHWSAELAIASSQMRNLDLRVPSGAVGSGDFRMTPGFLTMKYNFNRDGSFRPYLGVGLGIVAFHGADTGAVGLSRTVAAPAVQTGLDIRLSNRWVLNADIKWTRERATVSYEGSPVGQLRLDPLLLGIGIGYQFGHSSP